MPVIAFQQSIWKWPKTKISGLITFLFGGSGESAEDTWARLRVCWISSPHVLPLGSNSFYREGTKDSKLRRTCLVKLWDLNPAAAQSRRILLQLSPLSQPSSPLPPPRVLQNSVCWRFLIPNRGSTPAHWLLILLLLPFHLRVPPLASCAGQKPSVSKLK